MKKYTREDLLKICEQAFVNTDKWHDRDSYHSQCQLAQCYVLLKDNCDFKVIYEDEKHPYCQTDEHTIWLEISATGFDWFEGGEMATETFYLPTQKRLDEVNGNDWY